jgi:hypothetical protein
MSLQESLQDTAVLRPSKQQRTVGRPISAPIAFSLKLDEVTATLLHQTCQREGSTASGFVRCLLRQEFSRRGELGTCSSLR